MCQYVIASMKEPTLHILSEMCFFWGTWRYSRLCLRSRILVTHRPRMLIASLAIFCELTVTLAV